ncbi:hypothetical protein SCLCIDRAFT_1223310 [Scleroderma citrinum Foug A]|uniref:Uncharacterized protein n=1 Tax=Scleroderma citrinum Foug A TaxID=1036808 RepID=A0A0C3CWG4_9AGAM|nr:hypothetical protein SCLCIDRAFT_1223310 [Scleroderma citrinum Foug A]
MTWVRARCKEEWFATNQPWCNLDSSHKSLLRTSKLVDRPSNILAELIVRRLSEIQEELCRYCSKQERCTKNCHHHHHLATP